VGKRNRFVTISEEKKKGQGTGGEVGQKKKKKEERESGGKKGALREGGVSRGGEKKLNRQLKARGHHGKGKTGRLEGGMRSKEGRTYTLKSSDGLPSKKKKKKAYQPIEKNGRRPAREEGGGGHPLSQKETDSKEKLRQAYP